MGFLKGSIRASDIGALIGFGARCTIFIIRNHQNDIRREPCFFSFAGGLINPKCTKP